MFNSIKKMESEKALEKRLVEEVKAREGLTIKITSQFHKGLPDRLVLLPYHTIAFVELKSTGQSPRRLQEIAMARLSRLGFRSLVISSTAELEYFLQRMDARLQKFADKEDENSL